MKWSILLITVSFLMLSSAARAWINEGETALKFKMYQYKDQNFDIDTVIGKRILLLIAGSIT